MNHTGTGKICWQSPANIALVKYWGKKGLQLPANPSLSVTLSRSLTRMTVEYEPSAQRRALSLEFLFGGKENPAFERKIRAFLESAGHEMDFLEGLRLKISSHNTFPHSSGIASSASSMSALALCLLTVQERLTGSVMDRELFFNKASGLARLASGSACRSVYGGMVLWGKAQGFPGSSDEYAMPYPNPIHEDFRNLKDSILVVSTAEKKVSSRAGHALMENHPYAQARYASAGDHLATLAKALSSGDMVSFIRIIEAEAMELHALMMTSAKSYLLIEPGTVHIVNKTRDYRDKTGVPVGFTLDAGPNVHLLYPARYASEVRPWIETELSVYCQEGMVIHDEAGNGPEEIEDHYER